MTLDSTRLLVDGAEHAEGPVWDELRECVWWLDVFCGAIHRYDVLTGKDMMYGAGVRVGSLALTVDGDLLLGAERGFARYDLAEGRLHWVASVECGEWMNDGACDPRGRFFAGTLVDEARAGQAALYRLDRGAVSLVFGGVTISNGIGWSPDGRRAFYIDTPRRCVTRFDYDVEKGALSNGSIFADLAAMNGRPDGMAVDTEGGVWVAMAKGGACVVRLDPTGQVDHLIPMPALNVTNLAFGGAELSDLFVTTSRYGLPAGSASADRKAGALLSLTGTGYTGLPSALYIPERAPDDAD